MNRLDRILLESDAPAASPRFVAGVMEAIERAERAPAPLAFPWWAVVATAIVGLLAALVGLAGPEGALSVAPVDGRILLALAVLGGSGLVSYFTVEWIRD
ncbi:MAG: hypothetical protein R2991_09800 [Thermoanaerobaculia bacterium]